MRVFGIKLIMMMVLALLLANCKKLERDNPWDDKATLEPGEWAPEDFQAEDVSITEKKLTWTYDDKNIEGFKLDRKKGDEQWQVGFQTFSKETRSWHDTDIIPDPALTYSYRLYSYAGKNVSSKNSTTASAAIPAPTHLQLEKLSDISYKLTWQDNSNGEDGFKIDRKTADSEWVIGYGTVGENTTTFVDTNVFAGKSSINIQYRVYAYYEGFVSAIADANTNAALTPPTNLQITQNSITSVTLNWQDNSTGEEGFRVERKQGTANWELLTTLTGISFTDTDFLLNTDVSYRIASYYGQYASDYVESSFNSQIAAPANLEIVQNTITSVTMSWQDNSSGEEGFRIERKQGTGNWELLATLTGISYTDYAFELNTDVSYRVAAYHGQYASDYVESSFNSQIPSPENLTITANSADSLTLNWSYSITGHEGFKIEKKIDNGSWVLLEDNLNHSQTSYTDSDIDLNNYNYHYRMNAFFGQFASQQIDFPEIPFLCGILNIIDSRDGSQYLTVQIGNQCWMKENLKWLPNVSPSANGSNSSTYHYVYGYQGSSVGEARGTANYQTYGVLYNWPAALNACPQGWHLPSDSEWTVLTDYLGGSSVAGGKMKTTGTAHWNSPNTGATNSSGFSGLPGGYRNSDGSFGVLGYYGGWWSFTEDSSPNAWRRYLDYDYADAYRHSNYKELGFSVRCLRD